MNVQSVNNYITPPHFTGNPVPENSDINVVQENIEEKNKGYSGKQLSGAVVAAALSAAVLGGAVMHGKGKSAIRKLTSENSRLQNTIEQGVQEIKKLTEGNEKLTTANTSLTNDNNMLKQANCLQATMTNLLK